MKFGTRSRGLKSCQSIFLSLENCVTSSFLVKMTKWPFLKFRLSHLQKLQMALNETLISFPVKTLWFRFTYVNYIRELKQTRRRQKRERHLKM